MISTFLFLASLLASADMPPTDKFFVRMDARRTLELTRRPKNIEEVNVHSTNSCQLKATLAPNDRFPIREGDQIHVAQYTVSEDGQIQMQFQPLRGRKMRLLCRLQKGPRHQVEQQLLQEFPEFEFRYGRGKSRSPEDSSLHQVYERDEMGEIEQ